LISGQFRRHHRQGSSGRRKVGNDSGSSNGTRPVPGESEVAPDDEDWWSAGTVDSDLALMTADGTDDNASRTDSLHSDECGSLPGRVVEDEVNRSSTPFTAVVEYVGRLKKLFDKSTKVSRYRKIFPCLSIHRKRVLGDKH